MKHQKSIYAGAVIGLATVGYVTSGAWSQAAPASGSNQTITGSKAEIERLDLSFNEVPVVDVLSIIEKATSLKIVFDVGLGSKRVSIKAEDITAIEAVKLTSKAAGLPFRKTAEGVYFIENPQTKWKLGNKQRNGTG